MKASRGLATAIFLLAASLVTADDVRVLVNGRAIDTPVIETNGTVYVPVEAISKALGADVKVERGEVRVQQPAPPQPVVASAPVAVYFQTVPSIKGKLTFYDHAWQPKRPDIGATVWLVRDDQLPALAKAANGTAAEPIPAKAAGWDAKFATDFKFPQAAADEDGRFVFNNLPPGSYLLIYMSRHSNGLAARDRNGKMRFKKIVVTAGQTTEASCDFGQPAYREEMR